VDDVVQVALAAQVPLHRVEAQLDQRHAAGAKLLTDDLVDRPLDGRGRRLNLLRPVVQDREVVRQRRHRLGLRRDQDRGTPVRLHRQLEPLVMRDRPEDVRCHSAADVDVKVGQLQAGIEHL
jgi:hypothetical protein